MQLLEIAEKGRRWVEEAKKCVEELGMEEREVQQLEERNLNRVNNLAREGTHRSDRRSY